MKRFLLFFTSMILSLAVMLIPWGLYLFGNQFQNKAIKSEAKATVSYNEQLLIQINDNDKCLAFFIVTLKNTDISLLVLPPQTIGDDMGKFVPLTQIEDNGGLKYTAKSLNDTYGFNIGKYTKLEKKKLSILLDLFGSCDFNIPHPVTLKNGTTLFKEGRQLINSDKMLLLLEENDGAPFLEDINLFGEIISSLISQQGSFTPKNWEKIFNILANGDESSLSIMDFMVFKECSLFKEGFTSTHKEISGTFSEDMNTFLPKK